MACALVGPGRVRWSRGFGLANIEHQQSMSPDTLINVGSVSKTVTATAVMQLWEENRFGLQEDVAKHLPFSLRNPHFPEVPITFEQLLTHRSSIKDHWPTLDPLYVCGDSPVALGEFLKGYFTPGSAFWNEANWHLWPPGTENPPAEPTWYSNVGFGVLGYLVEGLSQQPFSAFCQKRIFAPLGMNHTGWFLRDIDVSHHATPYERTSAVRISPNGAELFRKLTPSGIDLESLPAGTLVPRCLYNFSNYPDGSLRTSANELARFVAAYVGEGRGFGHQLLKSETLALMFSGRHFGRNLGWSKHKCSDGRYVFMHGGMDPGISAFIAFDPQSRVGVVCVRNFESTFEQIYHLTDQLLSAGRRIT